MTARKSLKSVTLHKIKPLRGYPKMAAFASIGDVRSYLAGDKVVCLLCGREFVKLGNHVSLSHDMSSDDYRRLFGIPLRYALAGKSYLAAERRRSRRLRRLGIIPSPSAETIKKWIRARQSRRPLSAVSRQAARDHLTRVNGKENPWERKDYEEMLRRILTGRPLREVAGDGDVPSYDMFHWYLRKNPDLRKQYEDFWEKAPFAAQLRAHMTGDRYCRTLVRLRMSGKTWPQVARAMKVREGNVRGMWHRLRRSGRLEKYVHYRRKQFKR